MVNIISHINVYVIIIMYTFDLDHLNLFWFKLTCVSPNIVRPCIATR